MKDPSAEQRLIDKAYRNLLLPESIHLISREDLIDLLLNLPVDLVGTDGTPMTVQSSFGAVLEDARIATGRDLDGTLLDRSRAGSCLGALGYLCLVDQLGNVFKTDETIDSHSFIATLIQRGGLTVAEAESLYALRNAVAHNYAIATIGKGRRAKQLTQRFALTTAGKLVVPAKKPWDGSHTVTSINDSITTVNVAALADLVETVVTDMREIAANGQRLELTDDLDGYTLRSRYFFTFSSSSGPPTVTGAPKFS